METELFDARGNGKHSGVTLMEKSMHDEHFYKVAPFNKQ